MKRTALALLASATLLTSCASDANVQKLADLKLDCAAGNAWACPLIPVQEQINHDEANSNALTAVGVVLVGIPLAILAGAAVAPHPPPMMPPPRFGP
jgi:hypothetical protein